MPVLEVCKQPCYFTQLNLWSFSNLCTFSS